MARVAEILAGRYELLEVIGRGGMGVVHRARDRILERTVAVKVLPAEYAENPTLAERFAREARAAARLSHPNIVAVFDTGRDAGARYIVMECVPGISLAQLLAERGRLEVEEGVGIAAQMAGAIAAAHTAGIVHRDIKPANVMVQPDETVKVLDFGIAHAAADPALTRATMVLGSAPYMAPEVALGRAADERSDIYSLGCVLYEMLTGRPPFTGTLPEAVMNQQANVAPQPLRDLEPTVPAALDALAMRMLAKRAEERPQPAAGLPRALRDSLREPVSASASPPVVAPPPSRPPVRLPEPGSARGSRRGWIVLAAALAAVAVGVVALIASGAATRHRGSGPHRPRTPAPPLPRVVTSRASPAAPAKTSGPSRAPATTTTTPTTPTAGRTSTTAPATTPTTTATRP